MFKKIGKAKTIINEKGLAYFFTLIVRRFFSLFKKPFFYLVSPLAIKSVRKSFFKNKENAIDFVFNGFLGIIAPLQIKEEISQFMLFLEGNSKPKIIMEIGTARGGVLFLLAKSAAEDAVIISVDLPSSDNKYPKWRTRLYKNFVSGKQKIYLLMMDSHQPSTINEVKKILNSGKIDLLFIDGDHSYEGVKKDFEMYGELVKSGGVIAFHDIVVHPPGANCGVNKFWNETKDNFKYLEIIKERNQGWGGIGMLYK